MDVVETEIDGVKVIEPDVLGCGRCLFCETYNVEQYCKAEFSIDW